jgi:hypothetical protein
MSSRTVPEDKIVSIQLEKTHKAVQGDNLTAHFKQNVSKPRF